MHELTRIYRVAPLKIYQNLSRIGELENRLTQIAQRPQIILLRTRIARIGTNMTKDDYLKELNNPESWFKQAFVQKLVADQLTDVIIKNKFPQIKDGFDHPAFVYLWGAAVFHYAIGIENGLKGIIVKRKHSLVHYDIDGDDVTLRNIGGKASKKHDLYSLCHASGLLDKDSDFKQTDKIFKNVMMSLSDTIRWAARYPVPIVNSKTFVMDKDVPSVTIYGFHVLDTIEPMYDYFKKVREE